jgi:CheY-like chemotaxis protein
MAELKRVLFVDDELENVSAVCQILTEADIIVEQVTTVRAAVEALQQRTFNLLVTDIFIPMGSTPEAIMGPRARRYIDNLRHLGGLALLDEIERMDAPPIVLAHTACTDYALIEILGDHVSERVPKPAPVDTLLQAVMRALSPPKDWTL